MHKELILYALLLFIYCPLISAQEHVNPDNDSIYASSVDVDEIIVSASRSDLKIKELPASVSIVSQKVISANNITTLTGLNSYTPNFTMPDYGSKLTSPVYIRGVGSRINNPSVGLYVDNVPYFEKSAFQFDLFDIERIEILRGPQGTLFGRNSMGGLINIVTRSPLRYQGTDVSVTAGNYGVYILNAGYYGKISSGAGFSLTGNYTHNDGFYRNELSDSPVDKLNSYGLRSKLALSFSDHLTAENTASFEKSLQGGYPYGIYDPLFSETKAVNYNQASSYDRLMFSDALNLKYSANGLNVTNTVSYQFIDDIQRIDQDFTPDSLYFVEQLQKQHMAANELIARSDGDGRYSWLTGTFLFMQNIIADVDVDDYRRNMWYVKSYDNTVKGIAFFHQSVYKITRNLSLLMGLRYDHERSVMHYSYTGQLSGNSLPPADTLYPWLKDNILLPKFAVNYAINSDLSVYFSYTTGYKAGGFNTTFERPEHLVFRNEKSFNYETGFKSSLFDKMLDMDIAVFFTRLMNQQIYRTAPSGRGAYLDNAGISANKGFEITLNSRELSGFESSVAYGYTNSVILKYEKDTLVNYNGRFTPYIPRHTFTAMLTKTFRISKPEVLDLVSINLSYNHNGMLYWDLNNSLSQNAYGLLNAKLSLVAGKARLEFWFKNLTATRYNSFVFEALGNIYGQSGKPFQAGITGSVTL